MIQRPGPDRRNDVLERNLGEKPRGAPLLVETAEDIAGLDEWLSFWQGLAGETRGQDAFRQWGASVAAHGCIEPLTGHRMDGGEIENPAALREGLSYRGVCSRVRAVMLVIERIVAEQQLHSPAIYAAEATTPFALRLRGIYPRFTGSEFTLDPAKREAMYPIPFEDLHRLTLKSDAFDIVSTNEVLEHVPSPDRALAELCRVLRPGGWHVGTVPFNYFSATSLRRATLEDGEVVHLLEPEYHGDPMSANGVLVFEAPGWDILERARAAGFSRAFMRHVVSLRHGVVDEHVGGVFVFCCRK
jgi:hypothetical protein